MPKNELLPVASTEADTNTTNASLELARGIRQNIYIEPLKSPESQEKVQELEEAAEVIGEIVLGKTAKLEDLTDSQELPEDIVAGTGKDEPPEPPEAPPADIKDSVDGPHESHDETAPSAEGGGGGEKPPEPPEAPPTPEDDGEDGPEDDMDNSVLEELGYTDADLLAKAAEHHISREAFEKAATLYYPLEILIQAMESDHGLLYQDLVKQGIPLPPSRWTPDLPHRQTRSEIRRSQTEAANAGSEYPEHITKSEVLYYLEKIEESPGWLRNSLISPGSLPVAENLYRNPAIRPILDAVNIVYRPIGKRLLARRLFHKKRRDNPHEDYGVTGYGQDERREILEHIDAVNVTIKRARYMLSWRRRHTNRGHIRKLARLDLASEIAGVRKDLLAFSLGRDALPSKEEKEYLQLGRLGIRSKEEQKKFEEIEREHPGWVDELRGN